ncbi:hypothetical protein DFQ27_006391 [Actinomortierella ambigua]|uniref:Acid phosphatase n=1 Tax=Actinomortierella ambigua TaxID=1343610 RepID=A0A9P6PXL2_9FUNG|nr:hypothetical protein DFQ27_006391 [Actinomortierella ambigua]
MKFKTTTLLTLATALAFVSAAPIEKRKGPFVPGTMFDRILVVFMENTDYTEAAGNEHMVALAKRGVLLSDLSATTHPSQPNYVAFLSASIDGIHDNGNHKSKRENLVDLLEAKGISWKGYQEDYPGGCFLFDSTNLLYRRKHNPFMSFASITNNPTRCAKIVNANQLNADIANHNVPQFAFYTPNMDHNGHDTSLRYSSNWLHGFIEPLLNNADFMKNTAIVITFDEDETKIPSNHNRVYSILLGGAVRASPGTVDITPYTHYSILATIEDNWGLGHINNNDASATVLKNLGYEELCEDCGGEPGMNNIAPHTNFFPSLPVAPALISSENSKS